MSASKSRVFIDVNVFIDYAARREAGGEAALRLLRHLEAKAFPVAASAGTWPMVFFHANKYYKKDGAKAKQLLLYLMRFVDLQSVDVHVIRKAIVSPIADLEDAIQYEHAVLWKADVIVSADKDGFNGLAIPKRSPEAWLAEFADA